MCPTNANTFPDGSAPGDRQTAVEPGRGAAAAVARRGLVHRVGRRGGRHGSGSDQGNYRLHSSGNFTGLLTWPSGRFKVKNPLGQGVIIYPESTLEWSSLTYVKAKVGRREFQSLQNLADSVPVSPPSLSSAIREGIQSHGLSLIDRIRALPG